MATQVGWGEMRRLLVEADLRARDKAALDAYHWALLTASARLATTRLLINRPSHVLDATEAALLRPLEAAFVDPLSRLMADLAAGGRRPAGRVRR
jgi:hypothetical protein